jgi:AcrR family transcriptional regulator
VQRLDTFCVYDVTVSDLLNRRALKKAHTNELIRSVAQSLFLERGFDDVTIADVARAADVAVQTVFNHFATKEDLFFAGRVPWVEGPATAIRTRGAHMTPLAALRTYLVGLIETRVSDRRLEERQRSISVLEGSEALVIKERRLVREAEGHTAAALAEAWRDQGPPADVETAAQLTAAIWTATIRVMIIDRRDADPTGTDPQAVAEEFCALTDVVLRQLETCLPPVLLGAPVKTATTAA